MKLDDVNDQRKHAQLVAIWKENKKAFRIRKRFNRKARREQNLKHVDELFKKNKNEFWKEVKKIERKNTTSVNIPVDQVKNAYEKVFTEKNTQWDDSDKLAEEKIKRLSQKLENESQPFIIDENELFNMIHHLSNGRSTGLRGVTQEMLKYCNAFDLCGELKRLYETMISDGLMPHAFNVSVLKPIIKSNAKSNEDITNTRPVAISDSIANLFERVCLNELNKSHKEHHKQFGFKSNSSCQHAIFVLKQAMILSRSRKQRLYVTAVDASKAFDKVVRNKLWSKLMDKNIPECLTAALANYYNDNFMVVQIGVKFF